MESAPKVPKLRLVIPSVVGKKSVIISELVNSLPSVPMVPLDVCVQKAVQWTFRQLESFHEVLPRMGDVERRHALTVLARQCHSLWREVRKCFDFEERTLLALRGIEQLRREEEERGKAVQELEYQNYLMPSCALPGHPWKKLVQIQSQDHSYAFPWDITKFLVSNNNEEKSNSSNSNTLLSLFIRREVFKLCKLNGPVQVSRFTKEGVQLIFIDEFILEFTIAPADNEDGYSWFLLKASLVDVKLAAQVGNSLTGMLQHRPLSLIKGDVEIYRNFCFLQQIYLQFQDARKNVDLTLESGSGSLRISLWGKFIIFEVKIHQDTGKLTLLNIPNTAVRAAPSPGLVESLIDEAAAAKFKKFAVRIKSWASAAPADSYVICEDVNALSIFSNRIQESPKLNFWLNRRTGQVHCDHNTNQNNNVVEEDLKFIADYFNHHILSRLVQDRTEPPILIIKSELNKWSLRDARLFLLKQEIEKMDEDGDQNSSELAVALALTLHPTSQTLREQLVMLAKDPLGITRIVQTKQLCGEQATLSAAEEYLLDYRLSANGICVDKATGEIVNACVTPGIIRFLLDPINRQVIIQTTQEEQKVDFEKWHQLPQLITDIVRKNNQ